MGCVWRWERPTNLPPPRLLSSFAGGSGGCSPPPRDGSLSLVVTLLPAQGSARTPGWAYPAFRHKVSPSGRWQGAHSPPAPRTPQTTGCPAPRGPSRVRPAARRQALPASPPAHGCPGWSATLHPIGPSTPGRHPDACPDRGFPATRRFPERHGAAAAAPKPRLRSRAGRSGAERAAPLPRRLHGHSPADPSVVDPRFSPSACPGSPLGCGHGSPRGASRHHRHRPGPSAFASHLCGTPPPAPGSRCGRRPLGVPWVRSACPQGGTITGPELPERPGPGAAGGRDPLPPALAAAAGAAGASRPAVGCAPGAAALGHGKRNWEAGA